MRQVLAKTASMRQVLAMFLSIERVSGHNSGYSQVQRSSYSQQNSIDYWPTLPLPQGAGRLKRECRSHTLEDRLVVGCFSCHLYLLVFSLEPKAPVGTSCEPKAHKGYKLKPKSAQIGCNGRVFTWSTVRYLDWIVYRKVIFWPKTAGLLVLGHFIVPEIAC